MPFVYPIPDLLPAALAREIRTALDRPEADWVDGRASAGRDAARKRNRELKPDSELRRSLSGMIGRHLSDLTQPGGRALYTCAEPVRWSDFLFSRTTEGGGYGDHMDNHIMPVGGGGMRSDMSMTVFLSDPEEYEGGELVIDSDMGFAPRFKLPMGGAVLYSTLAVHRVAPVTAGERVVALTWVESRWRDPLSRQLNADLLECLGLVAQQSGIDAPVKDRLIVKLEKVRGILQKRDGG